jgi:hypothetical protein
MSRPAPLHDNVFEAVTAGPQPTAAAPRRRKVAAVPAAPPAGAPAHRVGTIAAPYTRQDGVSVRQWSCTLPVEVVDALQIASIQERRRPADIVADLIAAHCGLQLAAAPVPKQPRAIKPTSKPKTRKTKGKRT